MMLFFNKPIVSFEFGINIKTDSSKDAYIELCAIETNGKRTVETLIKTLNVDEFKTLRDQINNADELLMLYENLQLKGAEEEKKEPLTLVETPEGFDVLRKGE